MAQLRLAEKWDFWEVFTKTDVEQMMLKGADAIQSLQAEVERLHDVVLKASACTECASCQDRAKRVLDGRE